MAACADSVLSKDTNPKHFDKFVCLSMKTFAEITFPNGTNVDAKSVSANSCGKWYINRLHPSGPVNDKKIQEILLKFFFARRRVKKTIHNKIWHKQQDGTLDFFIIYIF